MSRCDLGHIETEFPCYPYFSAIFALPDSAFRAKIAEWITSEKNDLRSGQAILLEQVLQKAEGAV